MAKPHVLFAITVYNGREVVFPCLRSVARMAPKKTVVHVLVLDDASPEPGFSEEVEAACAELGLGYYRSPRNLGIPRNVNLALLWALEADYDYVVVANSDVLFCRGLTDLMVDVATTDPSIGSVTAWSNNVSVYSLPNVDPDQYLGNQDTVDSFARCALGKFRLDGRRHPGGHLLLHFDPDAGRATRWIDGSRLRERVLRGDGLDAAQQEPRLPRDIGPIVLRVPPEPLYERRGRSSPCGAQQCARERGHHRSPLSIFPLAGLGIHQLGHPSFPARRRRSRTGPRPRHGSGGTSSHSGSCHAGSGTLNTSRRRHRGTGG